MPSTEHDDSNGVLAILLVTALIALFIVFGSITQGKSNDEMRAYCDQHGGVFRAASDGGEIISVTCRDGKQFQQ